MADLTRRPYDRCGAGQTKGCGLRRDQHADQNPTVDPSPFEHPFVEPRRLTAAVAPDPSPVTRQDGETQTSFVVRVIRYEAWERGAGEMHEEIMENIGYNPGGGPANPYRDEAVRDAAAAV